MGKLTSELFVNEFSRRGFVDGRILRLPAVTVRHGAPAAATSAAFISGVSAASNSSLPIFICLLCSGIIREPLKGIESLCPIGDSVDSPALELPLWLASPQTTIKNFIIARHITADKFLSHTRVVCLPGFTATVRDELVALEKVGGKKALELVKFTDDPVNRRLVSSWPARFDNTYPLSLGFIVDEGGMEPIVRQFQKDIEAGIA